MTKESLERLLVDYGVSFTSALADRLLQEFNPGICEDAISRQHFDERVRLAGGMVDEELSEEFKSGVLTVLEMLKTEPPVITSRPTGHWIEEYTPDGDTTYRCSECDELFCLFDGTPTDYLYHYCPNCGARMESEEQA